MLVFIQLISYGSYPKSAMYLSFWAGSAISKMVVVVKKFLHIPYYDPRYVKCSPNVALSVAEKITVIRGVDQKISLPKYKNRVF